MHPRVYPEDKYVQRITWLLSTVAQTRNRAIGRKTKRIGIAEGMDSVENGDEMASPVGSTKQDAMK